MSPLDAGDRAGSTPTACITLWRPRAPDNRTEGPGGRTVVTAHAEHGAMAVLVTGALGNLGRLTLSELVRRGLTVRSLDLASR